MKGKIKINIIENEIKGFDIDIELESIEELMTVLEGLGIKAR